MFTVTWSAEVLDRLAELYVGEPVPERERMAAGVAALNHRLAADPFEVGESRDGNRRVTFAALLMVRFRIEPATRIVRVTGVTRFGR